MVISENTKTIKRNHLNIITWNAGGLHLKRNELQALLQDKDVDEACIQETLLTSNIRPFMDNYTLVRKDRRKERKKEIRWERTCYADKKRTPIPDTAKHPNKLRKSRHNRNPD